MARTIVWVFKFADYHVLSDHMSGSAVLVGDTKGDAVAPPPWLANQALAPVSTHAGETTELRFWARHIGDSGVTGFYRVGLVVGSAGPAR
jgi:hypothetical protein